MATLDVLTIIAAFGGGLSGAAVLGWWLASRFNNTYTRQNDMERRLSEKIDATKDLLVDKIAAHEKLDNTRFESQQLAIMRIELLMQSGGMNPVQLPIERPRP